MFKDNDDIFNKDESFEILEIPGKNVNTENKGDTVQSNIRKAEDTLQSNTQKEETNSDNTINISSLEKTINNESKEFNESFLLKPKKEQSIEQSKNIADLSINVNAKYRNKKMIMKTVNCWRIMSC